jgi:hypothetical protein
MKVCGVLTIEFYEFLSRNCMTMILLVSFTCWFPVSRGNKVLNVYYLEYSKITKMLFTQYHVR